MLAKSSVFALVFCLLGPFTLSEELAPNDRQAISFYFENDIFSDTDRYYTNGVRLSWLSPDLESLDLPGWAKQLKSAIPGLNRAGYTNNIGLALGQAMYTPEDIESSALVTDDRPYAGWLYGALSLHNKSDIHLNKLELALGVIGPESQAEETQRYVHEERDLLVPRGWDHQLRTEVGAILTYEHQRRYSYPSKAEWGADLISMGSVSLGNVLTQVAAGVTTRAGYNVPASFHGNRIRVSGYVQPNGPVQQKPWSAYIFGSCELRAVARDITLDGNSTKDSHRVERIPFVGEAEVGFGVRYRRYQLRYSHVLRTEEFAGQGGSQKFGSLGLVVEF